MEIYKTIEHELMLLTIQFDLVSSFQQDYHVTTNVHHDFIETHTHSTEVEVKRIFSYKCGRYYNTY